MKPRFIFLFGACVLACAGDDGDGQAATGSSTGTAAPTSDDAPPGSSGAPTSAATTEGSEVDTASTPSTSSTPDTTEDGLDGSSDTATTTGAVGDGGSFNWVLNRPASHDYGRRLELPPTFGVGEFTFQMWIKPDDSFPVGPTAGEDLTNWSSEDIEPYASGDWWYRGNFLLDGHNNISGFSDGTFSLQFYGGGRVRWLFGDGAFVNGGVWSAGAYPAETTPTLLDRNWHQLTLVRRWSGDRSADLELWIDGDLVASETSPARTNMRDYWDEWTGFGEAQAGWFWGAEKQAAIGALTQYEDYKGLMAEVRFWDVALTNIADTYADAIDGDEPGLVGYVPWNEGAGTEACDVITAACVELVATDDVQWQDEGPPLQ